MSAWGKLDRLELITNSIYTTAYANVVNGSNTVYAFATVSGNIVPAAVFTAANAQPGYSLVLANVNYRIKKVDANATYIVMDPAYGANSANITNVAVNQSPKWIRNPWGNAITRTRWANTIGKRAVYGVDRNEANVAGNKANGFTSTGWVEYHTYTTSTGNVRHKVNTLVAMSKNFNANATGVLQTDANDDGYIRNTQ
jgi:hypothetical protein